MLLFRIIRLRIVLRVFRMSLAVGDWCERRVPKRPTSAG